MKKETQSIIKNFETTLHGQPWFGRAVFDILKEVNETKVNIKPGGKEHSMLELIWHMNTWAEFCLKQLQNAPQAEIKKVQALDWRKLDPNKHNWKKGVAQLKKIHSQIVSILKKKDDAFLSEMVKLRSFNYRFMLNGLIQHNIYHLGQIAYLNKMLG